jgi:MYXO-CTERM domain-containing protein
MKSSYRRLLLVTLATSALLGLSLIGSGAALAASGIQAGVHTGSGGNGNGNGDNGNGGNGNGNGNNGHGNGTATPELPSGVLFGLGLVPLGAGLLLVWRRRRSELV